jgi:hypothetical protein
MEAPSSGCVRLAWQVAGTLVTPPRFGAAVGRLPNTFHDLLITTRLK